MTPDAAVTALQVSFFDWGLHAWGIFAVMGQAMAWAFWRDLSRGPDATSASEWGEVELSAKPSPRETVRPP